MKKIFLFISPLIAFFLGGFILSFTCHAQAMPSIDTSTFTVIQGGNQNLIDVGFTPQNIVPYSPINQGSWSPWNLGFVALSAVDENDCTVDILSDEDKSYLLSQFTVVNVNGTQLTLTDNIYHVHYDNGYFEGDCYIDSSGKLLGYSDDLGGNLLQIKYGGSIKDTSDWEQLFEDTAQDISDNNMNLNADNLSVTGQTFYLFFGDQTGQTRYAEGLYIANQYQKGVIVPTNTSNGSTIKSWYTNNLNCIVKLNPQNLAPFNNTSVFKVTSGTFRKDNINYNYQVVYRQSSEFGGLTFGDSYSSWINWTSNGKWFIREGYWYNTTTNNNAQNGNISFKPLQVPNGSQIINYNYYYDYDRISELEQQLNNLQDTLNSNYVNSQPVTESNYPIYSDGTHIENSPSEIPFPNIENYPGYNPMPTPDPSAAPSIGSDIGEVDPTELRSTIPVINNLLNRFPFSIPWDIYGLLSGLSVQRETPYINTTIHIPGINYDWVLDYDLSDFDGIASLFRTLFLIAFILGLAYFSYDHFFGS